MEKRNTIFLAGIMKTVLLGTHRARPEQAVPAIKSSCSLFWLCHHGANMQGPGSPQTAESCGCCCCGCCGGGCLGGASSRRAWTVTATWPNPFSSKMCRGKHNCSLLKEADVGVSHTGVTLLTQSQSIHLEKQNRGHTFTQQKKTLQKARLTKQVQMYKLPKIQCSSSRRQDSWRTLWEGHLGSRNTAWFVNVSDCRRGEGRPKSK